MVPVKQSIPINFAAGLDTKNDPWQINQSNFLALNNSVFTTGGRITKRNGFPSLGSSINAPTFTPTYSNIGSNITSAVKLFSYSNELCLNDSFNLYSYEQSNNKWSYMGRSTMCSVSTSKISQDKFTKSDMDCCIDTVNNLKFYAWIEQSILVHYSIQDLATGQFIVNNSNLPAGGGGTYGKPRLMSSGGITFLVLTDGGTGNTIYTVKFTGSTSGGTTDTSITNLNGTHQNYDIGVYNNNFYIVYYTSGGTPSIKIAQLNSSFAVVNSITKVEVGSNGVSMFSDGTNIWVVYNNSAATKAFVVNLAVTSTTAAPTIIDNAATALNVVNVTGTWSSTLSKAFIFYDTTGILINFNTATLSGATITPGTENYFNKGVSIVSKAFSISGIPHIVVLYTSTLQSTYFLLNLYNKDITIGAIQFYSNVAGKIAADEAGIANTSGQLASANNPSSSVWEFALGQKTGLGFNTSSTTIYSSVGVIDAQINFAPINPDAQVLGRNANISSGQLIMYDGANVVEQNFHIYPEGITGVAAAGGVLSAGLYGYRVTYEWTDNQGQVHRSTPSPTFSITVAANQKVTLTVPNLRVTNKNGVLIKVYRTVANLSIYYLVNTSLTQTPNDPTSDTQAIADDSVSDTTLINNLQLYTTGEVDDFAIPAPGALTTFKNRVLAVSAEGLTDFFFSKQVQVGFPVEFAPDFDVNVGTVGGNITTIANMDDKIIIFKSGLSAGPAILYMVGTGPAASGANNDFTDPLPVAVDCGCVDKSSVVLTPNGLIFKSDKGIYLLDRSLQVSYIGAPVESYNSYTVWSSQLIPNTTQVRFILSNGTMLMYDYFYNQWGTFTPPAGVSDCIFQGQHTYVSSAGIVYKETPGTYYDGASTPILINFTTAWIKLAGLQGYQRAYAFFLLGEYISAHTLSLSISYDFSASSAQTTVITPRTTDVLENWRVFLAKQRCQSFQIALQEVYGGTPGAAFTMSGLNLIAGVKSKWRTISAAQTAG